MSRISELAEYLGIDESDLRQSDYDENLFECDVDDSAEYLVLTDEEADQKTREYIEQSVWAFNPWFIIQHSKLPFEAEEMVKGFQEAKCEDANETILVLIVDFDEFVADAIDADGRGHFLSGYDGVEIERRIILSTAPIKPPEELARIQRNHIWLG